VAARPKSSDEAAANDASGLGKGPGSTRIALLVNGEPITAYEVEQRARLMALGADIQARAQARMKELASSEAVNARWKQIVEETVKANQGKTREQIMAILQERQKTFSMGLQKQAIEGARAASIPAMRENAKKELIEEQIKLQDARRNGAAPDESMVEDLVKDIAQRNKMTSAEFTKHFAGMGVDIMTLKARFRAQLAWTDAVRRQYGHLTQPSQRQLDQALVNFSGGEDQVELQLHRIVMPVPPKLDQKAMAQKLSEAEQLQRQFKTCGGVAALAAKVQGARHENMGSRSASSFQEPTRSMLLAAQENTMVPPAMTSSGIELYAVCGRKVIKAAELKRNQLANEERQGAFERLSRNHLRKLMDNAIIENR
jgi:peptidyl-prolyl cis-trans isomerase SurA